MDGNATTATRVRSCLQTRFYGVYSLLKLKILKAYGLELDDILARDLQKARDIVKKLADAGEIPEMVLRECMCLEVEGRQKLPVVESIYPQHLELLFGELIGQPRIPLMTM